VRFTKGLLAIVLLIAALAATSVVWADDIIVPLAEDDFDVTIPATGSVIDPATSKDGLDLAKGKEIHCRLVDTYPFGSAIVVRVVDADSLVALGTWVDIDEGQTKLLWTNNTTEDKVVRLQVSCDWPWSVRAMGQWVRP